MSPGSGSACSTRSTGTEDLTLLGVTLFDHLVGTGEQRWRKRDAERLGGFQVDHQLELGWRLHRQFGWLGALQDAIDIAGRAPEKVDVYGAIGHQPADRGYKAGGIDCRQAGPGGKGDDGVAMCDAGGA